MATALEGDEGSESRPGRSLPPGKTQYPFYMRLGGRWVGRSGDRILVGAGFSTRPDRPWGPPSVLYNGYRVFPGGKVRPGRAADHAPPSSAEYLEEYSYTSTPPPLWVTTGPVTGLLYLTHVHSCPPVLLAKLCLWGYKEFTQNIKGWLLEDLKLEVKRIRDLH